MCDLTRSGDGQVAESLLSLSGRLGCSPCQLDPASITAGGSAGRKVGIVARLGRRASFPVDLAKTMTSWKFVGRGPSRTGTMAGSLTPVYGLRFLSPGGLNGVDCGRVEAFTSRAFIPVGSMNGLMRGPPDFF
jgi:hypothetical protein